MKILIVDDEKLLVKGMKFNFEQDGYTVETAYDGEEALKLAHDKNLDIIILDLMLPKIDGLSVCQKIREFSSIPIIMVTAKAEDMDKIMGLEYGADDYITKPFNILELKARVKAIMRRITPVAKEGDVHVRRLREKIEPNSAEPKYLLTKWGAGYYFRDIG